MQAGKIEDLNKRRKQAKKQKEKKSSENKTEAKIIPLRSIDDRPDEEEIPVRRAEKTPRQKQEEVRFIIALCMALCVIFIMGWSVGRTLKEIHNGTQVINLKAPEEVALDNQKHAGETLDADGLIKKLLDNVAFDVELERLDDSVAEGMISAAQGTKLQMYLGNGAYADEIILMIAQSEEDAKENQKNVEAHLAEMKEQFGVYIPEQVKKIDNAVQVRSGCYVIVCVTSDTDTAKKTIETFLQQ